MVVIWPPVWISIWLTLIGGEHTNSETACFGTHDGKCYSFSLTCNEMEIIRIAAAQYGYKHSAGIGECCELDRNDCFANYSHMHAATLYESCSGKTTCFKIRAHTAPNFECQNFSGRTYAHVKYDCIMANTVVDMCNASVTSASEVNIMFKENKLSVGNSTCYCQITAQTSVKYQLVDIRLFTNLNNKYICINGFFSINDTRIQCSIGPDDVTFIYVNSPLFEGEIPADQNLTLLLIYQGNVHPDMVWVNLKASSSLAIYCQNLIPTIETATTTPIEIVKKTTMQNGNSEDGISVAAIIGVVIAAIIVIAVVAVALIIFKRRQKKSTNHVYDRSVEVVKNSEVVETSNYDVISDESVLNCSLPEKDKKDTTTIPVTVDKKNDVSTDEYDKNQFKMKDAMKASNYDRLAALNGKIGDDPYSHVSNGSKSVTIATCTVNDYSHCKPNIKDTLRNGDDYSHCKPNSKDTIGNGDDYSHCKSNSKDTLGNGGDYSHCKPNSKDTLGNGDDYSHCKPNSKDTLRNGDDYSRAVLERDCTIKPDSDINEEDSYNHIDFDDTKHPM